MIALVCTDFGIKCIVMEKDLQTEVLSIEQMEERQEAAMASVNVTIEAETIEIC